MITTFDTDDRPASPLGRFTLGNQTGDSKPQGQSRHGGKKINTAPSHTSNLTPFLGYTTHSLVTIITELRRVKLKQYNFVLIEASIKG
jgi:hypothetical protein